MGAYPGETRRSLIQYLSDAYHDTCESSNVAKLPGIPVEIMDSVLVFTDPRTVSAFSRVAHTYYSYIRDNSYLWRCMYIKYFDDPWDYGQDGVDWKVEVQRRTRAYLVANSPSPSSEDIESATQTLVDVVQTARPGASNSQTIAWLNRRIPLKFIWPEKEDNLTLSRARLQVLKCECQTDRDERLISRSYTYDMRHYVRVNRYGPFLPQLPGEPLRLNYVHLRHIMNVQFNNMYDSHNDPDDHALWMPRGFNSTRPMTASPSPVEDDWAGVEGEWVSFVGWMGYDNLAGIYIYILLHLFVFHSHFSRIQRTFTQIMPAALAQILSSQWPNGELASLDAILDTSIFQATNFSEVHAIVPISMHVVSIDPQPENSTLRPTIHFEGVTTGGASDSRVKGHISDEGDGVIHWHLSSILGNTRRWQTYGAQIGGAQSAAVSSILISTVVPS